MSTAKWYFSLFVIVLLLTVSVDAQAPQINSTSKDTISRSGRLRIFGSNFGSSVASSHVLIDGIPAIITRWNDTQINAYVPELSGPGTSELRVMTSGGASNSIPLTVTLRQPQGRVNWTFEADVLDLWWRPTLASDGIIYLHGSDGFVFALSPDGGLKWATQVNWYGYVPPAVGPDGSIYVGSIQRITALNPDGSQRWLFSDPTSQGVQSGPAVGPDGNIYFANDFGIGAYSLSPNGQLRWNNPGSPTIQWYGGTGGETILGSHTIGGVIDQMYIVPEPYMEDYSLQAFSLTDGSLRFSVIIEGQDNPFGQQQTQPAVGPNGTVYVTHMRAFGGIGWVLEAYSPVDGHSLWYYHGIGSVNGMTPPDVGPDGVIYYSANSSRMIAVNPDTHLPNWEYQDGTIMYHPTVSPLNDIVVTGGVATFGDVGFIKAINTVTGLLKWSVPLPGAFYPEPRVVSVDHPRFTPDGRMVYVSTTILGGSASDPHSFLYAVETRPDSTVNVELASFTFTVNRNMVSLKWRTVTETNNHGFEIQRSTLTGKEYNWKVIGFVNGGGSRTEPAAYSFNDEPMSGKYLYRLNQIDFDGASEFSNEIEINVVTPNEFSIEQNYPNPFNPATSIGYHLPEQSQVTLKVFNILGVEVAVLVNEIKPAGSYEIRFNASEFASGVYFYKLQAGSFSQVKKMILSK